MHIRFYSLLIMASCFVFSCNLGTSKESDELQKQQDRILEMGKKKLIQKVDWLLRNEKRNWVLFESGTIVMVDSGYNEPRTKDIALDIIKKHGAIDKDKDSTTMVDISRIQDMNAWVVFFYHPDIIVFVQPLDIGTGSYYSNQSVGDKGLWKRDWDSKHQEILHVSME